MADIKVRGLDPVIIKKLDELAKATGMSREEYLRKYISKLAIINDVERVEDKYTNLVNLLADRLEQANDVIENNSIILREITRGQV